MPAITKGHRITIPSEIRKIKGWTIGTELIFIPKVNDDDNVGKDTTIIIQEVQTSDSKRKSDNK